MPAFTDNNKPWPLLRLVLFRFFAIYLLLYHSPKILLPDYWWNAVVTWAGKLLIRRGYEIEYWPAGSGDTTFNYLQLFCLLILTLIINCIWWAIDHKRKNDDKAQYWIMTLFRYQLACIMFGYGIAKVIPTQFTLPLLYKLDQPFGESSPMGLAWTFMGASPGYTIFSGIAECIAGLFLLFRRTRLFGALLCMIVMANVMALNFFYDICVKLFSTHLFISALFLITPDLSRIGRFFFLHQTVAPANEYRPVYRRKWLRYLHTGTKYSVIAGLLYYLVATGFYQHRYLLKSTSTGPLYGSYEVISYNRIPTPADSRLLRPTTPSPQWKNIYFEKGNLVLFKDTTGDVAGVHVVIDTLLHKVNWRMGKDSDSTRIHYTILQSNQLVLQGHIAGDSVQLTLRKKDTDHYLLMTRGFHWVNEFGLNK
ncbi:hypothetical protein [Chitinophaga flava]|uniref:DoxX family protein n=1 Tax=Chitinophaga flava TaxID=2259036 RepID=A0A365Y0I2_9BACT|nr:hypothetical protein [Chitinophaga flava]RBL91345.1 hypothetical protein DF182_01595 [Chitinophaga flava]